MKNQKCPHISMIRFDVPGYLNLRSSRYCFDGGQWIEARRYFSPFIRPELRSLISRDDSSKKLADISDRFMFMAFISFFLAAFGMILSIIFFRYFRLFHSLAKPTILMFIVGAISAVMSRRNFRLMVESYMRFQQDRGREPAGFRRFDVTDEEIIST